jgi:ABC-type multidrug transport system fused ATPase/permease subunit
MPTAAPTSTLTLLRGIWGHINRRRRTQLGLLLLVMLTSGAAEMVSLGAVLPFLAVLSDQELLWQQPQIQALARRAGFTAASQLLLPATAAFAAAAVAAALIRLANLWLSGRLAAAVGSDLSCEVYQRTLYQPYDVHVQRNSSDLITAVVGHVSRTVGALTSLLQLVMATVVAVGLVTGLLLIDWQVALAASGLFGGIYGLLAISTRWKLQKNSQRIATAAGQQVKALQEGLGAIRDVLLDGRQPAYLEIYRRADRPQRQFQAQNSFLGAFPRYGMEALGMVAIAVLGWLLVLQRGSGGGVIQLLGTVALGAQRLLPALQQVYAGWASLRASNASLAEVLALLEQPMPPQLARVPPLLLEKGIRMDSVRFRYGPELMEVLQGLDLEIRRGERIGLIGRTGSGKSTTIDLLMGLLVPSTGRLLVDGVDVHDPAHPERVMAWRAAIAHVPQNIYLADSSIAENIALGVPKAHIDLARVKNAAEQAQIASFIENSYGGYGSFVGERGIRLSGGQRQRIGIARALYKQASVLVFDEATSALDTATEEAVMDAIESLSQELIIVMIAHRLTTLQRCDRVIRLANGTVSADGPPQLVLARQF